MTTTPLIVYVFATVGILDTLLLLTYGMMKKDVPCPFFPKAWCRKVQYSTYSATFGIPNALWGFLIYTSLFVLMYMAEAGRVSFAAVQGVVALGAAFSVYFLFIQAFVLRAFCTWCVVSAVNFGVLFWAVFLR